MNNTNQNTALLVMDMQNSIIKSYADAGKLIPSVVKALHTAHANKIPVIYCAVGFRKGYPEVSPDNKSFSMLKNSDMQLDNEQSYAVHSSVAPHPGDVVVIKKRVSAFTGSDMEIVLRSLGIKHIVLTGVATSGVVLSTLREAADKDYTITVLLDCCADRDEEVHRVLTTKVFSRQANVITADEWSVTIKDN